MNVFKNYSPREVLFSNEITSDGEPPIFSSQKQIIDIIFKSEHASKFKSSESLKTYLSRAISGKRSFSKKLIEVVTYAINSHVKNDKEAKIIEELFLRAVNNKDINNNIISPSLFKKLRSIAGKHVIITDNPFEFRLTRTSRKIFKIMLENLNVISPNNNREGDFQYEYFLKNLQTAERIWRNIYTYLTNELGLEANFVAEKLKHLNKNKLLRIYYSEPYIASHNLYLHNIEEENSIAIKTYNKNQIFYNVPDNELNNLCENLYYPLKGELIKEKLVRQVFYLTPDERIKLEFQTEN